ncbi:SusC/RagA family TonB-linked outer membrane protein [Chitinophaga hostae]|uniref:SusC/RagA family TonB-linked outer membrane protein n=1 Tax=Chitinophaga hostae TaxID=2831022 RepID=A0ABS5IXG1_9BACT|nr:SusC/RagA family TonB-linked outer membrane protein [Chitinophaga hostae]MBS0027626.1 SusC/RagA family TonB-linked outer membrane protein [Chitinophaga hostae]
MKKMLGFPSARRVLQGFAMRLSGLFLLLLIVAAAAAQDPDRDLLNKQVSYHAEGRPLLKVLKEIRTLTDVRFTYNLDIIRQQPAVTVNAKSTTLGELLRLILANTSLAFDVDLGGIAIYPQNRSIAPDQKVMMIVRGQVTTSSGPLAGVTVQAINSKEGTVTTKDGLFSLAANENDQLRISMVGMKTVFHKVTTSGGDLVIIRLDTVSQAIQEVVVNGYQKIDAKMATAAIFKLDAKEVIEPGVTSVDQMLQGKVPGLMVINSSGSVNARPTIRMRGTSTFVGNGSPLWVIDNVVRPDPVDISSTQLNTAITDGQSGDYSLIGGAVSGLNPYDIESITFLKDAAATAIYGVRAANGVIVVTTKKGKAGPMQINYNTNFSFQQRPSYSNLALMNSKERVAFSREMVADKTSYSGSYNAFKESISYEGLLQALYARRITEDQFKTAVAKLETNNTDWFKTLFRNSFGMTHSVSMSGGVGKTTYYGSVSYSDNNGAAQQDGNKRYTADLSVHSEANSKLSVDLRLTGSYGKSQGYYPGVNPLTYALKTNRAISQDAVYPVSGSTDFNQYPVPPSITYNMLNEIASSENHASTRSMTAAITLSYRILKGLQFTNASNIVTDAAEQMSAAYDKSNYISSRRGWNIDFTPTDIQAAKSQIPYGGLATISNMNSLKVDTRNDLMYTMDLFSGRDQLILTAGNQITSIQMKGAGSTEPGYFPDRGQQFFASEYSRQYYSRHTITNTVSNVVSMYGNAIYSLNNKYVVTGTIRTDGSNRFGQYSNAKFLPNYGLSARWNLDNENFLKNNRLFSGVVLRASFGTQGAVVGAVGPELIASYERSGSINPITGVPYLGIKSLPYPDLRWEKTYQWNFGADLSVFDRRLNFNLDYYLKKSVNLISPRQIAYEYGMDQMYENAGIALNRGLELVMNVEIIRRKNTNFSLRFINSWNQNEVAETDTRNSYVTYLDGTALIPGKPRSAFYSFSYKGLDPQNGMPTFNYLNAKEMTNDPANFLVYSGHIYPTISGSFSSNFRYKNFSVSGDFYYAFGAHKRLNPLFNQNSKGIGVPNPFDNANRAFTDRWRKPGDEATTDIPRIVDQYGGGSQVQLPIIVAGTSVSTSPTLYAYEAYDKSDLRIVNSSFLRCRNLSFNYSVPAKVLGRSGVKGMAMGLFVRNVFTVASKKLQGQDPEIEGVGTDALPITRQYGFSMNVNF